MEKNLKIKWKPEVKTPMQVQEKEGVVYLTYPAFSQFTDICHGFTTRLGGVSKGMFASMNLSFTRGDEDGAVMENYRRLARAAGFSLEQAVCSHQTHTANVLRVYEEDKGKGIIKKQGYRDVDGLITNVPGITLMTSYADCVPLYFIDPVHRAVGLAHSGWRGTVGKIGAVTVRKMQEEFASDPKELYAAIGPSICQDCYEVSEDVAEQFAAVFFSHREEESLLYKTENRKYQLNLWRANELVFLEAGILKEHISFPGICTCCNPELLFSHRASQGKRGNLSAFLGLKKSMD